MGPLRKLFGGLILSAFIFGSIYFIKLNRHFGASIFLKGDKYHSAKVCAPLATILVNSAAANHLRREVIREYWGHPTITRKLGMAVAFGVGDTFDETLQKSLDWEAAVFGDIFHSIVPDEYTELPSKILNLFKKMRDACDNSPLFVIKVDDDVFVNVFSLEELLKSFQSESSSMKIWCLVWEGMPVVRNNESRWFLSRESYCHDFYPSYCSGAAYILNQKVLLSILQEHSDDSLLPFEDVYITGILADKAKVQHVQIGTRYAFQSASEQEIASGRTIFAHLGPNADERVEHFWNFLLWKRNAEKGL